MEFKRVTGAPPAGGTKKKRRAYVPRDKQARFIKSWKESGLTQTDFCKRLDKKRFSVKLDEGSPYELSHQQLSWLLAGLDWIDMSSFNALTYDDYF